ncbi:MAG: winged helix-turn-helix domain-containing protein [Alphaproteobacteria bacterium]|nr:winged helix-turn-helix domain-containing protein [Alphaproteobacteria bacterium]
MVQLFRDATATPTVGSAERSTGDPERPVASAERAFSFGPFRLLPGQQRLLEGETPVRLGSRALEILATLVERPGELVSKDELIARAWPNTTVEDSNLKVHIAALRKALGEGKPDHRYVATVPGRGYRFVAAVELVEPAILRRSARQLATGEPRHNLPPSTTRTIGRAETIDALLEQLARHRLVSIVGPGGIGKTTVALSAAEAVISAYEHGVRFVDLGPLSDPRFVAGAVASALGLTILADDPVGSLTGYVRDKQMLVVLDNCEHVIEATALVAEHVYCGAPDVHILTTSREPLRVRGEWIHRLSPLASPPASSGLTAAEALMFPAVQLFMERAAANLDCFQLNDTDAPIVAEICRKLEGIALAIELTATRTASFGLRELSTLLDDRLRLLSQARRTALPRHRTLAATLDWSYDLLAEGERTILRRLSVFARDFTLESAGAVASETGRIGPELIDGVASLVAKSLVSAKVGHAAMQYRLLDTTRAYALQKVADSGELDLIQRRHAEHCRAVLERASAESETRPSGEWLVDYAHLIDDTRNALRWAFSPGGDVSIGVALTIAAVPLWMQLSLLDECRDRIEQVLARDEGDQRPSDRDQIKLQTALGSAMLWTRGPRRETDIVWTRALEIAERLDDATYQVRLLWALAVYRVFIGDSRIALGFLERLRNIASTAGDTADRLSCQRLTATALHYLGEQTEARSRLEDMLRQYVEVPQSHIARFQFDQRAAARGTLANILWLQGHADQAIHTAQCTIEDAQAANHPVSVYGALGYTAFPIALYTGDLAAARRLLSMLQNHVSKQPIYPWNALCRCMEGMLLSRHGDVAGLFLLRSGLAEVRDSGFRLRYSYYLGALAEGLANAGQIAEAHAVIDEALQWSERREEWFLAELLRIKGYLFALERSATGDRAAAQHYQRAIRCAHQQGVLSLELRAATGLADVWHRQGRSEEAAKLLRPVYERFSEGFDTSDLKAAAALIEQLGDTPALPLPRSPRN